MFPRRRKKSTDVKMTCSTFKQCMKIISAVASKPRINKYQLVIRSMCASLFWVSSGISVGSQFPKYSGIMSDIPALFLQTF